MQRAIFMTMQLTATLGLTLTLASGAMAQGTTFTQIQRGRYLSKAGDCAACHTTKGGKPFAGGFPVPTPFGTIFSTNITPDLETGIGKWSNEDFYKAMHFGIRRDGDHLYPAFPYPWFTKLSRSDVDAIKAYLDTLAPVRQKNEPLGVPWPLSWRMSVLGWNTLFFDPGQYKANPDKSTVWNRGAYLVEGAGHCAACHTAKNMLGGSKSDEDLMGGDAGDSWYAPSLSSDKRDGIGAWTTQEIVQYLKTGANSKAAAAGPMRDVIMDSTQYLSADDLKAMAVYLQDLPDDPARAKKGAAADANSANTATAVQDAPAQGQNVSTDRGQALYADNCTACHMAKGKGQTNAFPALAGNPSVQAEKADSIVQVILAGTTAADPKTRPTGLTMPGYAWKFSDEEVADLATYIRNAWGNRAPAVSESDVAKVRKAVHKTGAGQKGGLTYLN